MEVAVEARELWDSDFANVWDLKVTVEALEVLDLEDAEVRDLEVAEVLIVFDLFVILPKTA